MRSDNLLLFKIKIMAQLDVVVNVSDRGALRVFYDFVCISSHLASRCNNKYIYPVVMRDILNSFII